MSNNDHDTASDDRSRFELDQQSVDNPVERTDSAPVVARLQQVTADWLAERAELFDPIKCGTKGRRAARRKAFAELGVYRAFSVAHGESVPDSLRELLLKRITDHRYYEKLGDEMDVLMGVGPFLAAELAGDLSQEERRVYQSVLDSLDASELPDHPVPRLEAWNALSLLGCERNPIDAVSQIQESTLAADETFLSVNIYEVYEATHIVYYYQNFGVRKSGRVADHLSCDLTAFFSGCILRFVGAADPDAVLEVLVAGILEDALPTEIVLFALNWLDDRLHDSNMLESKQYEDKSLIADEALTEMDSWDEREQEWANNYHTNVIGAFAGAVLSDRLDEVEASEIGSETPRARLYELAEVVDTIVNGHPDQVSVAVEELSESVVPERFPVVFETVQHHV